MAHTKRLPRASSQRRFSLAMVFVVAFVVGATLLTPASASAQPVGYDRCPAFFGCGGTDLTPDATNAETCDQKGSLFVFSTHACKADNADAEKAVKKQSAWPLGGHLDLVTNPLNDTARSWVGSLATSMANFVLTKELGSQNGLSSPQLAADNSADQNSWFVGQLAVIRSLGLFFIVPLMMLVVIQAVVRGSLFFLLRATFILLPAAVLGSVFFVSMAQLLSNVADAMCIGIANSTVNIHQWGEDMKSTINNMETFGLFAWMWLLMFLLASVAVLIELILREVGIYLSVLFLPIAFCALVWPPASRYARRLTEVLVGLIFSKVFIIGAFALGMAAFGQTGTANAGDGADTSTSASLGAIMTGSVAMFMAAFAGAKILSFTPAAIAGAEGYVLQRRNVANRGTYTTVKAINRLERQGKALNRVQPERRFSN